MYKYTQRSANRVKERIVNVLSDRARHLLQLSAKSGNIGDLLSFFTDPGVRR